MSQPRAGSVPGAGLALWGHCRKREEEGRGHGSCLSGACRKARGRRPKLPSPPALSESECVRPSTGGRQQMSYSRPELWGRGLREGPEGVTRRSTSVNATPNHLATEPRPHTTASLGLPSASFPGCCPLQSGSFSVLEMEVLQP